MPLLKDNDLPYHRSVHKPKYGFYRCNQPRSSSWIYDDDDGGGGGDGLMQQIASAAWKAKLINEDTVSGKYLVVKKV